MYRIGIVGLGKMGILHASILSASPEVAVVAFCEKNLLVRRFAAKLFQESRVVAQVRDLKGLGLDGVYVTTPPSSHFPVVKTIYEEGIAGNLFIEKPLASSYAEALELCQLAQARGGVAMVGYHKRFSVVFGKARDLLKEGALGEMMAFEAYAYSSDFFNAPSALKQAAARGSVLRDIGCHALDLALWFLGEVTVESAVVKPPVQGSLEDSTYARVRSLEGVPGEIKLSSSMQNYRLPQIGLELRGSRGTLRVNEDKLELALEGGKSHTWHRHDFDDRASFLLADSEYSREDEFFVQALTEGCAVEPSFQTAARVEHLIDQIQMAAEHGSHG